MNDGPLIHRHDAFRGRRPVSQGTVLEFELEPYAGSSCFELSTASLLASWQASWPRHIGFDDLTAAPDGIDTPKWVCGHPQRRTVMFEITTLISTSGFATLCATVRTVEKGARPK